MARINIEDSLFKDIRFLDLAFQLGSIETAIGSLIRAWVIAQQTWLEFDKKGIPKSKWIEQKLSNLIIDCGLAEDRGDYLYLKGSAEQFHWLEQKSLAGRSGGIESGKSRRLKSLKKTRSGTKRNEAERSGSKPLSLPLSLTQKKEDNSQTESDHPVEFSIPKLVQIWNTHAHPSLPRVKRVDPKASRARALAARWREIPDETYWIKVIERMNQSQFLLGRNERHWVSNIDFLIKPDKHNQIMEGKYDGSVKNTFRKVEIV